MAKKSRAPAPLRIRCLDSLGDVLKALGLVIRATAAGKLDPKHASVLVYGLATARQVVEARDAEARRAAGQPDGVTIGGVVVVPGTANDVNAYLESLKQQQAAISAFGRAQAAHLEGGGDDA